MSSHAVEEKYIDTVRELTDYDTLKKADCNELLEEIQRIALSKVEKFVRKACLESWQAAHSHSEIIIYEEDAWNQIFASLDIETEDTRKVLRLMHRYQSRDLLFANNIQNRDVQHDRIGLKNSSSPMEDPYPNALIIKKKTQFNLGQKVEFWNLQLLVEKGLSPAEALDYIASRKHEFTQVEWADIRGVSHQAISKNIQSGIDKFHNRNTTSKNEEEQKRWQNKATPDTTNQNESLSTNKPDFLINWSEQEPNSGQIPEERLERLRKVQNQREQSAESQINIDDEPTSTSSNPSAIQDQNRENESEQGHETRTTPENVIDWENIAEDRRFTAGELETAWHEMLDEQTGIYHPFIDTLTDDLGAETARYIAVTYAISETLTQSQMNQLADAVENRL